LSRKNLPQQNGIALNLPISGWGFVLFLISSVSWTVAGLRMRENSLALLHAVFTAINLLGTHRMGGRACPPLHDVPALKRI